MAILGFNKTAIIFFHFCNLEINFPEKGGLSLPSFSLCPSGGGTHVIRMLLMLVAWTPKSV